METREPMGKLDTVEVNGPEGEVLGWDAVDWRRVGATRLAHLILRAGGGRAVGAAGQRPRREERAGPPQDRQARRGVVGQAHRERPAAAEFRAARADPGVA